METVLDRLIDTLNRTDWHYEYSDDPREYRRGRASVDRAMKAIEEAKAIDPTGTIKVIETHRSIPDTKRQYLI